MRKQPSSSLYALQVEPGCPPSSRHRNGLIALFPASDKDLCEVSFPKDARNAGKSINNKKNGNLPGDGSYCARE